MKLNEREFNLIDEPWIRVMDESCKVVEVSLLDAIINAHKYKSLGGELPTQDVAVMRLILAVIHTVVSRYDEYGDENDLEDSEDDALDRWKGLWEQGYFPENAVREYLEQWHERFWLFHPDRPFGQVAGLTAGTDYNSPKLNGEISESGNKIRLFSAYSGKEKLSLTYSQSARWLLYLNAYDDTSAKPTKEGKAKAGGSLPSPGAGWLGKLGLIYISGNNLFETLMLNLVMINKDEVQYEQKPLWEYENISDAERTKIAIPDNLAELYTVQSRRLLLNRCNGEVVSYRLLGGDFFDKENAFFEPMTVWRTPKKEGEDYTPKRHDSSRQMWREFSVMYNEKNKNRRAGVINWYEIIFGNKCIPKTYIMKTAIASVEYGDKDFFVRNVFTDTLSMHSEILSEVGANWRSDIETEIQHCESLAYEIGEFARKLYIASGGSDNDTEDIRKNAKSQLYYRLDMPFRKWLISINPATMGEDKNKKIKEWQDEARKIAADYANELMDNTAECAIIGHKVNGELYSAPKARNIFIGKVKKIYEGSDKNE
jgi:CRISPR system Cascade subunit CasA